jgi:hypothetical protein
VDGDDNALLDQAVQRLQPALVRTLPDVYALGAEMYCWEVATALAGALMHINPFDQPNVQESKDNTSRVLQSGPPAQPEPGDIGALLPHIRPGDYFAIHAYLTPTDDAEAALQGLRVKVRDKFRVATTLGFGPRFLHSTGQLHKGGPPSGVFLQLTYAPVEDVPIPGMAFSFGTLIAAQSLGDWHSLHIRGLRVARVDLNADVAGGLERLVRAAD